MDYTIKDVQKDKKEIEVKIGEMLVEFMSKYDVKVTDIEIGRVLIHQGGLPAVVDINLDVKL